MGRPHRVCGWIDRHSYPSSSVFLYPPLSQDHWSHASSVCLFHSQPTSSVSVSSTRLSLYLISTGANTTAPTAHWHFSSSFPDSLCENSDHIFKPSYANQGAVDHLHTEASGAIRGWGQGPPQAVGKCSSRRVRGGQAFFNVISPPRPASQEEKCDLRVTQQPKYLPHQSLEFREFSPERKILIVEDVLHKHSLVSSKMGLWRPGISNLTHLMSVWQHCIMKNCALIILWGLVVRMCWLSTWMCWVTQHHFFGETYPFLVSAGLGCPFWWPVPSSSEVNIQLWLNLF